MVKKIIFYLIIILLLTIVSNTNATVLRNLNLDELISGSGKIIKGEVIFIDEIYINNKIKTIYTLCELEDLTNQPIDDCIEIEMMGSLSEPFMIGLPYLELNKIYILFLVESEKYFSPFYGWQQGIFEINGDIKNLVTNFRGLPVLGFNESNNDFDIGGQSEESLIFNQDGAYISYLEYYAINYNEFKSIINDKILQNNRNFLYIPQGLPKDQRPFQSGDTIKAAR